MSDSIEGSILKKNQKSAYAAELERQFREKYRQQNETLEKHFSDLAKQEFVLDHYSCSHLGNVLKPGRLFITPRYILFYSNILGAKTKKIIPFEKILEVRKESSAFVASPIEFHLKFKRYTFASFIYREQCYQHILLQWKSFKEGAPLDIKIPLEENHEEEESEDASLKSQQAPEPMAELQSVWGTGNARNQDSSTEAILDSDGLAPAPNPPPTKKRRGRKTLSQMPDFSVKKARSCFPCFGK